MISKIATICAISSIATADAFAMQTCKRHTTRLQYQDLSEDEWFNSCERELPSGAFGILPPQSSVSTDQDTAQSLQNTSSYTFRTDQGPLIPPSFAPNTSYSPNFDLPASSATSKDIEFKKAIELSFGRIAMLAASVLIIEEILTGESFPQQFMQLIEGGL